MDLTPSISANRPDALFIGPRPFSFFFFFFFTFYRAISWLRAYPLLKWSSTIFFPFFFFSMPPRGSKQTHCSLGPRPFSFLFFFFHATSWLRANTLPNRSSTVFSFITPPRGSEQTCCTIAPNHFFLIILHYYSL